MVKREHLYALLGAAGAGALVYLLTRAPRPPQKPEVPGAPAPAKVVIKFRAMWKGEDLQVRFRGLAPEGEWYTPAEVYIPDNLVDKVVSFLFPTSVVVGVADLTISKVEGANIVESRPDWARIDTLADKSKEVVVHYSEGKPLARWTGSDGSVIVVYDAWYKVKEDRAGVKFTFTSGGSYKHVRLIEKDSEQHGYLVRTFGIGSYIFEWATYGVGKPYEIEFDACLDTTTCGPAVRIPRDETRDITS